VEDDVSQQSLKVRLSPASRGPHLVRILPRPLVPLAIALPLGLCPAGRAGEPAGASTLAGRATFGDVKGTLVIVGGGATPQDVHHRFLELAGGVNAHLIIIPTANPNADRYQSLKSFTYWRSTKVQSVLFLHTRSRDQANDPVFVRPLTQATGVWFCGGDQSRVLAAYHGTAVERELHHVLDRGGVIGGTSAGAAIMSPVMITGGRTEASVGTGFGFLPGFVVDQHFKQRNRFGRLLGVLRKHPQLFGLGIDEKTAVIVHGHSLTVMGESNVRLYLPGGQSREQLLDRASKPLNLTTLSRTLTAQVQPEPVSHDTAPRTPPGTALLHNMGNR